MHAPQAGPQTASAGGIKASAAPTATKDDPSGKANQYVALLLTSNSGGDPVYGVDARFKQRVYKTDLGGGFFGAAEAHGLPMLDQGGGFFREQN